MSAEPISRYKPGDAPTAATKALVMIRPPWSPDAGPSIIVVDEDAVQSIGAKAGDIVEIQGKEKSLAKVIPSRSRDPHMRIAWDVSMDDDTMSRVGAAIGNTVVIRRVIDIPPAEKVILIPLRPVPKLAKKYLLRGLDGVPLMIGIQVTIPLFAKRLSFKVADVFPLKPSLDHPPAVVVNEKTVFVLRHP